MEHPFFNFKLVWRTLHEEQVQPGIEPGTSEVAGTRTFHYATLDTFHYATLDSPYLLTIVAVELEAPMS
jgi:hypothetical protein